MQQFATLVEYPENYEKMRRSLPIRARSVVIYMVKSGRKITFDFVIS
jgi:hypothetical protein